MNVRIFAQSAAVDSQKVGRYSSTVTSIAQLDSVSKLSRLLLYSRALQLLVLGLVVSLSVPSSPRAMAAPGDSHWDRQFRLQGSTNALFAIRFNGDKLYTGGYGIAATGLATNIAVDIWDGTNWSGLGEITGPTLAAISDLAFIGSNVYVSGTFTKAGGVAASGLARWDGVNWSGVGGFAGSLGVMTTDGTNLYIGGSFTNVGGSLITNVAKWNGTNWSALGPGLGLSGSSVLALEWHNGALYAGGIFTNAGNLSVSNIARWNGVSWFGLGEGANARVSALCFDGGNLYAGGRFTSIGGVAANSIARWNGSAWSALGSGVSGPPNTTPAGSIAILNGEVWVAGSLTNCGGVTANRIARWNGSIWSPIQQGFNGDVYQLRAYGGSIYAGGDFTTANFTQPEISVAVNHLARWDGSAWRGVGPLPANGTTFIVNTLYFANDSIYAGGSFTAIGQIAAPRIARWDGVNWSALGTGVIEAGGSARVGAIEARSGVVYAGGTFTGAGGSPATNIAMWNGVSWQVVGNGLNGGGVAALDADDTYLYAGGSFTNAFSPFFSVNRIARWDGFDWSPMGTGMNNSVNDVLVQGNLVYACGSFTSAGGVTANRVAVWNGSAWASLGSGAGNGLGGTANCIIADGADLYAGGSFTTAGGSSARAVAKWNGVGWSALGQGLFNSGTATVRGMAMINGKLYVTGSFTNAGGSLVVRGIASWDGTKWEALGSGIAGEGSQGTCLAAWDDDLFVGGSFNVAGLSESYNVARWNEQMDFTPHTAMRLLNPTMLPGNAFKFRVTSSENVTYVLEYSTDYSAWIPLLTNSSRGFDYTNVVPIGANQRVYRTRIIP